MAKKSESFPPSWIMKTNVKNGAEVRSYTNVKTGQSFYTRKNLDRYVDYVKREFPEVYAYWTNDDDGSKDNAAKGSKKAVGARRSSPATRPDTGNQEVSNGTSKRPRGRKKKAIGASSSIPITTPDASLEDPMPEVKSQGASEGIPKKPVNRKRKVVGATSSSPVITPDAPVKDLLLENDNQGISEDTSKRAWGRKKKAVGTSISVPATSPDASLKDQVLETGNQGVSMESGATMQAAPIQLQPQMPRRRT